MDNNSGFDSRSGNPALGLSHFKKPPSIRPLELNLPLAVLSFIIHILKKWGPNDAEWVEETHGEAEENGRANAEGQNHGVEIDAETFAFVLTGANC